MHTIVPSRNWRIELVLLEIHFQCVGLPYVLYLYIFIQMLLQLLVIVSKTVFQVFNLIADLE